MTNEVSINWNKNQSTESPIFEMFDDSEFESIQQEAMALYGEACYIQESYEEYILEAAENEKTKEPVLRKIGLVIKSLIERFIRAIERFMANQACKKAIDFFSNHMNLVFVTTMSDSNEKKSKLRECTAIFYRILDITNKLESGKMKDMTVGDIFNSLESMKQATLAKAFGKDGFFTYHNMKRMIHVMEREKVRYTAAIETVDQEQIIQIYTTMIKQFAKLQTDFIECYKYFSDMKNKNKIKL